MPKTPPLPKFRTIMADPPWPYEAPGKIGQTLEHRPNRDSTLACLGAGSVARYGKMSMRELKTLCVREVSEDDAHLYLWTTNSFMVEAHDLARCWGFEPKTIITWGKIKKDEDEPVPSMKMGYWFRSATEHCLFAVRGKLRLATPTAFPTLFLGHREQHSAKPDSFRKLVSEASPGPFLEMFARKVYPGWSVWGNEVPGNVYIPKSRDHVIASSDDTTNRI